VPTEIFKLTSAGAVDDGKSTILARLLLDTGSIFEDQLGSIDKKLNIADLLDGLESERDQGITIDVAHRFFDFGGRRFQIADSPGHEQYTRNMATACAGSDALLLVLDATQGLKAQSHLHLEIALRLGIRDFVIAVNKIDIVGYKRSAFDAVSAQLEKTMLARSRIFGEVSYTAIPVSGLLGHNIVKPANQLRWFQGPTLLQHLETLRPKVQEESFARITVQYVQRLTGGGRRYLGTVSGAELIVGNELWGGEAAVKVRRILECGQQVTKASSGSPVSLEFDRELDIGVGQTLATRPLDAHDQFEADLIWLSEVPGAIGNRYLLKSGSSSSRVTIAKLRRIDLETNEKGGQESTISVNAIMRCQISLVRKLMLQPFEKVPDLGRFILIDIANGATVAVGTVNFALRRSANLTRQGFAVTPAMHAEITGRSGEVLWFTGLPASGKSTLTNGLSQKLYEQRIPHYILDGDNLRLGINRDLNFSPADRTENIRRTAEVAALMANAGLVVLVALVSPQRSDRELAAEIIGPSRFKEVYVATPAEVCEQRDLKGLYKKAKNGEIPNFTGVTAPYEEPLEPWLRLDTAGDGLATLVAALLEA
jgi:bifunctional enzyme CysN/CysC